MTIALYTVGAFVLLLYLYVFTMGVRRAWSSIPVWVKVVLAPPVFVAVFWDWVVNMTFASLVFVDWPRSWKELVTGRLQRYQGDHTQPWWRRYLSDEICSVLDQFDPDGDHC